MKDLGLLCGIVFAWSSMASADTLDVTGFGLSLPEGIHIFLSLDDEINQISMPAGEIHRESDGTISRVGDQKIQRDIEQTITHIGNTAVTRDIDHTIAAIGDIAIHRDDANRITGIGNATIMRAMAQKITEISGDPRVRPVLGEKQSITVK